VTLRCSLPLVAVSSGRKTGFPSRGWSVLTSRGGRIAESRQERLPYFMHKKSGKTYSKRSQQQLIGERGCGKKVDRGHSLPAQLGGGSEARELLRLPRPKRLTPRLRGKISDRNRWGLRTRLKSWKTERSEGGNEGYTSPSESRIFSVEKKERIVVAGREEEGAFQRRERPVVSRASSWKGGKGEDDRLGGGDDDFSYTQAAGREKITAFYNDVTRGS